MIQTSTQSLFPTFLFPLFLKDALLILIAPFILLSHFGFSKIFNKQNTFPELQCGIFKYHPQSLLAFFLSDCPSLLLFNRFLPTPPCILKNQMLM